MKKSILALTLLFILTGILPAQSNTTSTANATSDFVLGKVEKIQSTQLNETRTLNIYLPDGYSADSARTYPVIYLLDGSANEDFIHIVGVVQFLSMIEAMPKTIVVGIANIDRKRDFTYPTTIEKDKRDFPTTGGSARFIAFIEKELQPFVEQKYKVSAYKTLIGETLGGLLATEILLNKPELFNNYMIVSPSLWWDNESLLAETKALSRKHLHSLINIYISVGAEGRIMEADTKRLAELLEKTDNKNLHINFEPLPDENHLTILHNSIYKGLKELYSKNK